MSEMHAEIKADAPATIYRNKYQAPVFLTDEIELNFDLNEDVTIVKSSMKIKRNPDSQSTDKKLILNGEELMLVSIMIDGKALPASQFNDSNNVLTIHDVPDQFQLDIVNKIYPQKNTALSGLYRSRNTYCTQCEPEGFRRITFFQDHPDVLTRFTTTIVANEAKYPVLLSNGNLIEHGKLANGRHWAKWQDPFYKSSYLFALVAGDFDRITDEYITQSGRKISLQIYVEKGYGEQAHHAMYSLKEAMRWDEKTYGREYDLDIYMIVAISDFNMGAMENKGLNIFNTKYVLAKPETATDNDYIHILSVVGHEYFHNWTGNRVTCRDWFQLSLKEGLTIFRDQTFSEDLLSEPVMRIQDVNYLRELQFPEDGGPLAHPVRPDSYIEINNFYTSTIYNKGAEVLRMLRTVIGKENFRKGMDLYFERFDGKAVTIDDYVQTMADVSGKDLTQFRLWYSQAGTPLVNVEDDYDASKKIYTLRLHQHTPSTPQQSDKKPLYIPVKMGLLDDKGNALVLQINGKNLGEETVLHLTENEQVFQFENMQKKPLPSLLRSFSAPVKLQYDYAPDDLLFLAKYDKDPFNRWEAAQKYFLQIKLNLIQDYQHEKALEFPESLPAFFTYLLEHDTEDKLFLAEMLTLPSERYVGEQMAVIDVDAIHAVRHFLLLKIAEKLEKILLKTYQKHHHLDFEFDINKIGERALKNRCLGYLLLLNHQAELGVAQFKAALNVNMTDALAALAGLNQLAIPARKVALDTFYQTWQHDALVMDKWLSLQAVSELPDALNEVKKLTRHPAFDIKNPNNVYSLIGAFGGRNPIHFHAKNGEGYAFLREMIQQLDKLNPQVAGRMVNPLTNWRRYDKERQALMREQLTLLSQDKKLSTDLYELITKSLAQH